MNALDDLQAAFNAVVAGVAATLVLWRILLPHVRKSIVGQMEPVAKQVDEIHQKTTVNHHTSSEPTILDMLSDVKEQNREVRSLLEEHIEDSKQHIARIDELEARKEPSRPGATFSVRLPKLPFSK